MSKLTEQELSAALQRVVAEPDEVPRRLTQVHQRARRLRGRRLAAGSSVLAVTFVMAMTATQLIRGPNDSAGPTDQPNLPTASTAPHGCPTTNACRPGTIPASLRRPLTLPRLLAGQPCPVSGSRRFGAGGGFSSAFRALGPGPFYLTGGGTISFDYPPTKDSGYAGTGWGGAKVIWAVDPAYSGPLLIRGGQIDGNHGLRFDHYIDSIGYSGSGPGDGKAYRDLAYPGASGRPILRTYPSAIRLRAAGCYAMQVDGIGFSELIVFRARLNPAR